MAMPVYTCIKCTACSHLHYHSQRRALLSLQSGITWNYRLSSSILCHDLELPTEDRGSFRTARIEDPYSTRPSCIWILQRRGLCNLAHQGRFVPCNRWLAFPGPSVLLDTSQWIKRCRGFASTCSSMAVTAICTSSTWHTFTLMAQAVVDE